MPNIYYNDYLQLDKILNSQEPESAKHNVHAHDEMLFIIIHQTYELWFKQIMYELDSSMEILQKDTIDDNSGELGMVVSRLHRIAEIWKLCIAQIEVLETMRSQDFLEFRNFLTPASGFQSLQFKLIEAKLGLEMTQRHGGEYYKRTGNGGFPKEDYQKISDAELGKTLKKLLVIWLERMPFLKQEYWQNAESSHNFWENYQEIFLNSLNEYENKESRLADFKSLFFEQGNGTFSPQALRSALFIMLYKDYPLFQIPYQILTVLMDIDEYMSVWRYKHLMMVTRMIGIRVGTGGINKEGQSQGGGGYLEGALRQHRIYREISELATYLIERRNLPQIPVGVRKNLTFE